jgi:hypothetical protein
MRHLSIFSFVVLFLFPAVALAEPLTPRPLDDVAAAIFARARAESPTVRNLVENIERSNVIVHIVSSRELGSQLGGTTRFIVSRAGYRYVRITLNAELPKASRTSILAHELQHAWEIAASDADDAESVRRLFDQAGMRDGDTYETRAAQLIEKAVAFEVRTAGMLGRSLDADPAQARTR